MQSSTAILLSGSPRPRGNTASALELVSRVLRERGFSVELVQLSRLAFGSCIACEKCRRDHACTGLTDELTPYYESLLAADLWVLGSPVYNYNVTSWMKAFLDRLYCFYEFDERDRHVWSSRLAGLNKRSMTLVVGEQTSDEDIGFAPDALRKPLEAHGIESVGSFVLKGHFKPSSLQENRPASLTLEQDVASAIVDSFGDEI
ncbi:MAG: flavodoxin family protein [Spirochaetota bacterium]